MLRRVHRLVAVVASRYRFPTYLTQVLSEATVFGEHLCLALSEPAVASLSPPIQVRQKSLDGAILGVQGQLRTSSSLNAPPGPELKTLDRLKLRPDSSNPADDAHPATPW